MTFDPAFPELLAKANQIEIDYDEDGIDFEPFEEFQSPDETQDWIRAWTGNDELTGAEYRVFGQDGTGGMAALWLQRPDAALLDQPVVFFGSEGDVGVVACDFADYLWLLAGGVGPMEAVDEYRGDDDGKPHAGFAALAAAEASAAKKTAAEVLKRASEAHPTFGADFMALCRH